MSKENRIVVLIPAYNPDSKMTGLVHELSKDFEHIVVVNDGCTGEFTRLFDEVKSEATVLVHEVNKGKGRALKTGFGYVKEQCDNKSESAMSNVLGVITVDADGQHTPEDVKKCCEVFLNNPETAVFGCRDFLSDTDIPPRSRFGNRLTSRLMKFFCDIELSDTQTGLRVLPVSSLGDLLEVKGERYEYEMNMIFTLKDLEINWVENPISVIYLENNESSHFNPIKDSIRIYKVFFKFMLSSFGSSIVDLVLFTAFQIIFKPLSEEMYVIIATVIARICSGIFNFSVNRWIFGSKAKIASAGPKYLIVWFVQMCLSAGIVTGLSRLIPINPTIIKIIVDTVLFFISYKFQQKWVFVKAKKDNNK